MIIQMREDKRIILDSNIIISLGIYGFFQLGGVILQPALRQRIVLARQAEIVITIFIFS